MLAIRMQRTGRKGHAQFRVVVQDSRFHPTSGRVVASLGSYNPHTKETTLDKDKATVYLSNGAQPSDRVAKLLEKEGVELPSWVKKPSEKKREIRNPDKLRRNRPEEPKAEEPATEAPEEVPAEPEEPSAAEPAPGDSTAEESPETAEEIAVPETETTPAEPATDKPVAEEETPEPAAEKS